MSISLFWVTIMKVEIMRVAYRAWRFTSKDWCIRNVIYMNGLRYNILEYLGFFWTGGWWCEFPTREKES